jgi:hypothetical protein
VSVIKAVAMETNAVAKWHLQHVPILYIYLLTQFKINMRQRTLL